MTKLKLPIWPEFNSDQVEIVTKVLNSGKVNYWTGKHGKLFEEKFSEWSNCKHSIALSNGSLALSSAYLALGLGEGDEFITTPRTFIATVSSGILIGAKPIFADIDSNSGAITAHSIEPLITKKTKLISVVHLGGWPADMLSICDLAKSKNISVVEDCAQAHGAKINGQSVGSFGDIGAWSFCQEKIITTGGEGGMVTTSCPYLYDKMWSFKDHGKTIESLRNKKNSLGYKLVHERLGSNFRLTEMQSALGIYQLKKLKEWHYIRKRNANLIYEALKDLKVIRIPRPTSEIQHAWYKFYSYIRQDALLTNWNRDRIINEINKLGYPAYTGSCGEIYLENCIKDKGFAPQNRLKVAKEMGETSLMFLIHPSINIDQMINYANTLRSILLKAQR